MDDPIKEVMQLEDDYIPVRDELVVDAALAMKHLFALAPDELSYDSIKWCLIALKEMNDHEAFREGWEFAIECIMEDVERFGLNLNDFGRLGNSIKDLQNGTLTIYKYNDDLADDQPC